MITIEDLKEHCEKQLERLPKRSKMYEEHLLTLNIINELQQKDKQIDLMLDKIDMTKPSPCTMTNEYSIGRVYMSKEEKRQYFETKAKGE